MMTSEDDEYVLLSPDNESFFYTTHGNDTYGMYEFYAVPQLVFISVVCIFIIVGNSCVLAAIRLSENGRKSRMNFFIMHLAIADLLVGVMVVITDLASKITVEWHAGNVMCKLSQYTQAAVTYSSTYMLVSLSIDRYDAVARPMNFSRSGLQGRFLVLVSWVVSLVFASPAFYLYSETVREGRKQCWMDLPEFWHWQLFFTAVFLVTFLLPAIIIATCYIAIIYIIWSKGRFHEPRSGHHTGGSSAIHPRLIINESRHDTGRGIIPQAKIRTIKMTLIIVIVFIMCWSPFFLYNLLDVYNIIAPNNPVSTLIQSAAPLNSAANPIIYGIFSTRICKNLRRIPLPSCLRTAACRCKEPRCARRGYRARHHNYLPSQTTDPTLTTLDVNRRIADFKLSGVKSAIRAGRRQKGLNEKDLNILNEAAVKLGRGQLAQKSNIFKSKGRNKCSENSGGLDYELAPLARRAKLSGKLPSEGSEESPPSSETIVHPVRNGSKSLIETDLRNGSNYGSCDALADTDGKGPGPGPGPASEVGGLRLNDDHVSFKMAQENSLCAKPDESRSSNDHVALISETASGDESSSCKVSSSKYSEGDIMEQIMRDCEELDFIKSDVFEDSELSLADDAYSVIGGGRVQHRSCSEGDPAMSLDANEHLYLESEGSEASLASRAQEGLTDRSLVHRRPSGVPTVRRRLTSEENNLLTKATCKWLMNEVKASESSVMS